MYRIIRRKLSGHVFGIILCLIGFGILFVVFWNAWSGISASSNVLSSLWSYILTEQIEIASIVTVKLSYLSIIGAIFLVLGIVIIAFSRQIFYLSGESVLLQCPYCKNQWRTSRAKGWAECPHCRQFVQPQVTKRS
mgnify:CR=1 FL=1